MLETLNFNKVLQDFQYKPNFYFVVYQVEGEWWIRITMLVENSREPFKPWEVKPEPQDDRLHWMDSFDLPPARMITMWSPSREVIEVQGRYPIPYFGPEDELPFVSWLVHTTKHIEEHEQDEWLRYKGELIRDPHAEVKLEPAQPRGN